VEDIAEKYIEEAAVAVDQPIRQKMEVPVEKTLGTSGCCK
jgi:hypothetical protein